MLVSRAGNAYTNDVNGNTLTGGGRTNTWDSENRMTQCAYNGTTSQFTYAADGLRHRSVVNGVTTDFALDASMFVREMRNGTSTATYLVGARGPEYRRDDVAGTVSWYLFDGLGSVLAEVSPTGTITSSRNYDVYGNVRSGVNANGTSAHKFVGNLGHPSDNNTGLIYMQARYMDPATGTFLSEDPAVSGINLYSYCLNDPVNKSDQSGCDPSQIINWLMSMIQDGGLNAVATFIRGMFRDSPAMSEEELARDTYLRMANEPECLDQLLRAATQDATGDGTELVRAVEIQDSIAVDQAENAIGIGQRVSALGDEVDEDLTVGLGGL